MPSKVQILLLNDIVSNIYNLKNFRDMRLKILEQLRSIMPYMLSTFYLASADDNQFLADPVGIDIEDKELYYYIEISDDDYSKNLFSSGRSMVYKESYFFPKEEFKDTGYYKRIFQPKKVKDALTLSIAVDGKFLGVITLYRNEEMPDFNDEEVFLMELLIPHLEARMSNEYSNIVHKSSTQLEVDMETIRARYSLTDRECEILSFLVAGRAIDDICQICNISNNTMRKHTMNIYRKLDIHSRPELAKLFL